MRFFNVEMCRMIWGGVCCYAQPDEMELCNNLICVRKMYTFCFRLLSLYNFVERN